MAEEPDRLRRNIEDTRASLTRDVDLLAEKTSPRQVAKRRWTAVKDKVMGSTEDARAASGNAAGSVKDTASHVGDVASHVGDVASEKAHDAADAVRSAPQAVAQQTQGNPIAAGIIAFGVGMLAATLIPVSEAEQRAGRQIRDNSGDLTDRIKDTAGDLGADLKSNLQDAATQVKETAQDAVQTTKEQAQDAGEQVKETAQQQRR